MAQRYSLEELRERATNGDVSFDLQRLYPQRFQERDPEVMSILAQGNASEALSWLRSTSPEGMETGKATREERLAKAAEHAAKSGIALEALAEENELTDLL